MAQSSCVCHPAEPVHAPAQIAVGDEGYTVGGTSWLDNGSKGDDWVGNLQDPNIAFGTVHVCKSPFCQASCLSKHSTGAWSGNAGSIASTAKQAFAAEKCSKCLQARNFENHTTV